MTQNQACQMATKEIKLFTTGLQNYIKLNSENNQLDSDNEEDLRQVLQDILPKNQHAEIEEEEKI